MRAPRLEGDSIPSMATTVEAGGRESGWLIARPLVFTLVTALGPGQMELHEAPFSLGLFNSTVLSLYGTSRGLAGTQKGTAIAGP